MGGGGLTLDHHSLGARHRDDRYHHLFLDPQEVEAAEGGQKAVGMIAQGHPQCVPDCDKTTLNPVISS